MQHFKVTDVRVRMTPLSGDIHLIVDGINQSDDLLLAVPPYRALLMLGVFNAGRDCFWDFTNKVFMTDPQPSVTGAGPTNKGDILGWEVRIPPTGSVEFQVDLAGTPPQPPASGNSAPSWAFVKVKPELAPLFLEMLRSRYTHWNNGVLRNADAILIS